MKTNELNVKEMEQVSGGNILADLEKIVTFIIGKPKKPVTPTRPKQVIARGKC